MKNIKRFFQKLVLAGGLLFMFFSCKPNGDENSTDTQNPLKETTLDSTRYPGMNDTVKAMTDTATIKN